MRVGKIGTISSIKHKLEDEVRWLSHCMLFFTFLKIQVNMIIIYNIGNNKHQTLPHSIFLTNINCISAALVVFRGLYSSNFYLISYYSTYMYFTLVSLTAVSVVYYNIDKTITLVFSGMFLLKLCWFYYYSRNIQRLKISFINAFFNKYSVSYKDKKQFELVKTKEAFEDWMRIYLLVRVVYIVDDMHTKIELVCLMVDAIKVFTFSWLIKNKNEKIRRVNIFLAIISNLFVCFTVYKIRDSCQCEKIIYFVYYGREISMNFMLLKFLFEL